MTAQEPLAELLRYLKAAGYRFVTVSPTTHAQVLSRPAQGQLSLRDIFGWNRPFGPRDVRPVVLQFLRAADALQEQDGILRSKVRVATLGDDLFLHSAFPTDDVDTVFFGPDTYRFARFIRQQLPNLGDANWLIDIGAGSGAGAIAAARIRTTIRTTLVDVNPEALKLAVTNAAVAGIQTDTLLSNTLPGGADLIIANPPYMMDPATRSYRNGGDLWGGAVSLDWVMQALARLTSGGTMLLYTGAAYVDGEAPMLQQMAKACAAAGASIEFDEIDPDVFGDELKQPAYARVERIAAVGVVVRT